MDSKPTSTDSLGYAWYVVMICMLAYIFSFIDRQILALLIEPIKKDLSISDTQFSLLHGLAFSLFYAIMGIPIAHLADRKTRPGIISCGVFFWSITTAGCGFAKEFMQLFIMRMGVGVGEAALSPPVFSMIRDMFPKEKTGFALSVYSMGAVLGGGLAYLVGGMVISFASGSEPVFGGFFGELAPWRIAFLLVGIPGVLIALVILLTVKDPPRTGMLKIASDNHNDNSSELSFVQVLSFIWLHKKAFFGIYIGFACTAIVFYGVLTWTPAFYLRNFDITIQQVSVYVGTQLLVFSTTGVLFAGWLIDRFSRHGYSDAAMRVGIIGSIAMVLPIVLYPMTEQLGMSLFFLAPALFFASFSMPASTAAMQLIAPNQMRAQITAIFLLISNIVSYGFGTLLVALCTDYVFGYEAAVGQSLALIGGMFSFISILVLASCLKDYRQSHALIDESLS